MKKIFSIFISIFLLCPVLSHAQQMATMRTMAVDQLYQYGQAIYDRGEYAEAARVFSRILAMNPDHEGAVSYAKALKKKGTNVVIPARSYLVATNHQMGPSDFSDSSDMNGDLRKNIQEADQVVEKLRKEVADLSVQIAQGQKNFPSNNDKDVVHKDQSK